MAALAIVEDLEILEERMKSVRGARRSLPSFNFLTGHSTCACISTWTVKSVPSPNTTPSSSRHQAMRLPATSSVTQAVRSVDHDGLSRIVSRSVPPASAPSTSTARFVQPPSHRHRRPTSQTGLQHPPELRVRLTHTAGPHWHEPFDPGTRGAVAEPTLPRHTGAGGVAAVHSRPHTLGQVQYGGMTAGHRQEEPRCQSRRAVGH